MPAHDLKDKFQVGAFDRFGGIWPVRKSVQRPSREMNAECIEIIGASMSCPSLVWGLL